MALDLYAIPTKIVEDNFVDKDSVVVDLIQEAYEAGLTLGLAAAHDKQLYQQIADFVTRD